MTSQLGELLAGAINHIDQRQVDLMIQLTDLKAVVANLSTSVHTEICKRPDFKSIQADVDAITAQLTSLHQALTSDPSVAGLAAVAQALNVPAAASAPAVAPTPVEAPVAVVTPVAAPAAPAVVVSASPAAPVASVAHGPATGVIPEWLKAAALKL